MRPAAHSGTTASFTAPEDTAKGRYKEMSMCSWWPCAFASSLAARKSSRLCRWKSICTVTFLAVHLASGHVASCAESLHARVHMQLLRCAAVPSTPVADVRLLAKVQREYRSSNVSALVIVA